MLGIAVIGCGDMGVKHAAAWNARNEANIVAVCDYNTERADKLAQAYSTNAYSQWQDAIAQDKVDLVSICVPACDHRDIAVASASLGRHILCEKAMALTLKEADAMIVAADTYNVCLSVCHQYRGLSRIQEIKRLIDEKRLGTPFFMRFTEMREVRPKLAMHMLSKNGGPVHDMTGHLFDLARYLTGSEAVSVAAFGSVFGKGKQRLDTVSDFGIDTAEIQVRFRGGHCLSIGINWGLPENTAGYCQDLIHGPAGMLYSEDSTHPDRFLGDISDTVRLVLKDADGTTRIPCNPDDDGPQVCVGELIDAIQDGSQSQFDGRQGRAALQLILASLEAIETGRLVEL